MSLIDAIDWLGEGGVLTLGSLFIGLSFGILAQRSRFCLRAAVIEFFRGSIGASVSIWLLTFFAAVSATQILIKFGLLEVNEARQLASAGSLSGAIIGGLMFGMGMVMARGCASRLLVLAGTGNLRSFFTGLLLTITAQASLNGVLSPVREYLSGLWMVQGGADRDLMAILGLSYNTTLVIGLIGMAGGIYYAVDNKVRFWRILGASGVGLMIAVGWWFTYSMSYQSFEPVPIMSITLIGPSADTLMTLINNPTIPMDFYLGLVPGIFFGAMLAAGISGTLRMECFDDQRRMPRYIGGAILMGFGGMLAGGCAVGAGVSGASIFSLTAWVALASMWAGAGLMDYLVDRKRLLIVSIPEITNEQHTPQPQ